MCSIILASKRTYVARLRIFRCVFTRVHGKMTQKKKEERKKKKNNVLFLIKCLLICQIRSTFAHRQIMAIMRFRIEKTRLTDTYARIKIVVFRLFVSLCLFNFLIKNEFSNGCARTGEMTRGFEV